MRYAQRFMATTRRPAAFLRRHHRTSGWRMTYQDTRRCQQNPLRWLALWNRRQAMVAARRARD